MKSIKQRLIDAELSFDIACTEHYNDLTQEDVDYIIKSIVWNAAYYLKEHPLLTKEHVDYFVKRMTWAAVMHLSHRFSEENISWIAENKPESLKEIFK